jgi:hypothetical protein
MNKLGTNKRFKGEEIQKQRKTSGSFIKSWKCGESQSFKKSKTINLSLKNREKELSKKH